MGKELVKYSCGHEEILQFSGPMKERAFRKSNLESCECPECWKAAQLKKAIESHQSDDWSTLTGSEKQIAWAKSIRTNFYKQIEEKLKVYTPVKNVTAFENGQKLLAWTKSETSAKFWIENRNAFSTSGQFLATLQLYGTFSDIMLQKTGMILITHKEE